MRAATRRKLIKAINSLLPLIEKCGGQGGTPGPCPSGDKKQIKSGDRETQRLKLSVSVNETSVSVEARRKETELSWLDVGSENKVVADAIFSVNSQEKSVYLSRIDAHMRGKGYARELASHMMKEFKDAGFQTMKTYVQYVDQDSQSMMAKLGGKRGKETSSGVYWDFDL